MLCTHGFDGILPCHIFREMTYIDQINSIYGEGTEANDFMSDVLDTIVIFHNHSRSVRLNRYIKVSHKEGITTISGVGLPDYDLFVNNEKHFFFLKKGEILTREEAYDFLDRRLYAESVRNHVPFPEMNEDRSYTFDAPFIEKSGIHVIQVPVLNERKRWDTLNVEIDAL